MRARSLHAQLEPALTLTAPKQPVFLACVVICRGEEDYLIEWIEFHRMMGVEHFFVYDNGLQPATKELLKPYIADRLVSHIPFADVNWPDLRSDWFDYHRPSIQELAYGHCITRRGQSRHSDDSCRSCASGCANATGVTSRPRPNKRKCHALAIVGRTARSVSRVRSSRCLIPGFDGALFSHEWREAGQADSQTHRQSGRSHPALAFRGQIPPIGWGSHSSSFASATIPYSAVIRCKDAPSCEVSSAAEWFASSDAK